MWVDSKKYHLHIELTAKCNSACPNCPRFIMGSSKLNPSINLSEIKLEDIKLWFKKSFIKKIGSINFCGNLGDPSNCTEMVEIVEYFYNNNKNVSIEIHTNGGARNIEFWEKLGKLSKISNNKIYVVFSVDGLEDTNHLYRRNVKWNKSTDNIKSYTKNGGFGIWEFLLFEHNEHQIYLAKYKCKEFGLDMIRFKKPIGFEDYTNNRTVPMGVYNKKGELEYIIKPSLEYINSEMKFVDTSDLLPNNLNLNIYDFLDNEINYNVYSNIENEEINCKSLKENGEIEIFLSYEGKLRPCCFIGVDLDRKTLDNYNIQLKDIFNYDCSLHTNRIENILQFFDDRIKKKWSDTFNNGKCIKCSLTCSKSVEFDYNRLYTKFEDT
jgi:hypothetical protein